MCRFRIYRDSDGSYIAFLYVYGNYTLSSWTESLVDAITHIYDYHDIDESYYVGYYKDLKLIFEASSVPSISTLEYEHPELFI